MPLIKFSAKDLSRGKIVDPAWYRMKIESIGEKSAKDGGSTNYPVEGTIIKNADTGDESFAGTTIDWNFNSKALGFLTGFLAAFGVEANETDRFELKMAEGKELEVFVENGEYQGRIVNRVNHKYRALRAS